MFRRHFVTFAVAVTLAAAATVAAGFDAEATRFYENAVARLERDDVPGAIIQLNNALQRDPGMLAAQVLLGRARLRNADPAGAEAAFDRALQLGVDRAEIALPLAQAYWGQGKWDLLLERIPVDGQPAATKVELLILRGNAQAETGNLAGALRTLAEARALDPGSVAARIAEGTVLLRAGQIAQAATAADEAVRSGPNESGAWNLRASAAHARGDLQSAVADYTKAIQLNPKNLDARVALAGVLIDTGRIDDAARALSEVQTLSPREPRAAYLRAVVASRRGDEAAVRAALTDAVALLDPAPKRLLARHPQLLLVGGLAHHGLGNTERAGDYLALYVRLNPNQIGPSKLLASIYIDRRDPAHAIDLLEPLQSKTPDDPQLLTLLAVANMAAGRFHIATPLLERALKVSGGAPDVRSEFGVSLVGSGQSELGFSQLQQAFARDPGQARAGVVLATMYANRGDPKKALETIDAVVKRDPKNVHAANLQGAIRVLGGDRAGGRASYERALALDPRYHAARLNLARLDVAEGKPEAARSRIDEVLRMAPSNGEGLIEMARLEEQTGRPTEAIALLEKARAVPAYRIRAGIPLVELHLRRGDSARALSVAKQLATRDAKNIGVLRALARAELAAGDKRGAQQTLSVLAPLVGFDPALNVDLARLQLAAGDREGASYSLERIQSRDYVPALVVMTEMQIYGADPAKAEPLIRRVAERTPASAVGARLQGDLAMVRRQPSQAIAHYRAALAKEPLGDTALRLNSAYAQAGEAAAGLAFLDEWCRSNPGDLAALRVLADARLRAGDLDAARNAYERLLLNAPEDVAVLNNLAQVAIRQGDKRAVEYAERAYAYAGQNAAVIDTLGWALVQQGQVDRGIGLLRDAKLRDATNRDIRYHFAAGLAQAGREGEARNELREILKEGARFDEIEEARKLQRRLGP